MQSGSGSTDRRLHALGMRMMGFLADAWLGGDFGA